MENLISLRAQKEVFLRRISNHSSVRKIGKIFPTLEPKKIFEAYEEAFKEEGRRLLQHTLSLARRAEIFSKTFSLTESEYKDSLVAILYHDFAKVLARLSIEENILLKQVLNPSLGHSLCASRLFLFLGELKIAQAIRHNSTDYVLDLMDKKLTKAQIVLNLCDKTDNSGAEVSIEEKLKIIKRKIGHFSDFDEFSEEMACKHLSSLLKENPINLNFSNGKKIPTKIVFIQRFDGKYCAPRKAYKDTSSNLKIAECLGRWGYESLIIHEGRFHDSPSKGVQIKGIDPGIIETSLPEIIVPYNFIVVEGTTTRLQAISRFLPEGKSLILLLRTLIDGFLVPERLEKSLAADEVWVMTREMASTVSDEYRKLEKSGIKIPEVRILQSGLDKVFRINRKIKRKRGKILYVGALAELKGVDLLIQAFSRVRRESKFAELHIIGSPEIYGSANKFDLGSLNQPGIVYHGVLPAKKIAYHLQTAHFSTLLTKKYETFGKSAMQARACGTRMLVSNQGALPLHVQDSTEGLVLDTLTIETVQQGLRKLLAETPVTVPPSPGRYHSWEVTALDLHSHLQLLSRKKFQATVPKRYSSHTNSQISSNIHPELG